MRIFIALASVTLLTAFTNFNDDINAAHKNCRESSSGTFTAQAVCLRSSERPIITAYVPRLLPAFEKYSARRVELAALIDDKKIDATQGKSLLDDAKVVLRMEVKRLAGEQGDQATALPQEQRRPVPPQATQQPSQTESRPDQSGGNLATILQMGTAFLDGYNRSRASSRDRGPIMTTCNVAGRMVNCLSD